MSQAVEESPAVKEIVEEDERKILEMSRALGGVTLQDATNAQVLSLAQPDKINPQIYPNFDSANREAFRMNGRVEGIEMTFKDRYDTFEVRLEETRVILSCDGVEYEIPHSEVEKEFELLGKNTGFDEVNYKSPRIDSQIKYGTELYKSIKSVRRDTANAIRFLKAKKICVDDLDLDDDDLKSVVQNKEEVIIKDSSVSEGYMWIYEKMRDRQLDLKFVKIESSLLNERMYFLDDLGEIDDMDHLFDDDDEFEFHSNNPNHKVENFYGSVTITEGNLKIIVKGTSPDPYIDYDSDGPCLADWVHPDCVVPTDWEDGFVSFEIVEESEGDNE